MRSGGILIIVDVISEKDISTERTPSGTRGELCGLQLQCLTPRQSRRKTQPLTINEVEAMLYN